MKYFVVEKYSMVYAKRNPIRKRRGVGRKMARRKPMVRRRLTPIATNTASVRENFTTTINDGVPTFYTTQFNDAIYNRAQEVGKNFQEYRVKYVKLIFRPSADTFPIGSGPIPQLYFQMNKYQAIPFGVTLQQLQDMGCRPIRFDDKNITKAYKPVVLMGADDSSAPQILSVVSAVKVTPWLSTNINAGTPNTWAPSNIQHNGCVFLVTKPSPSTATIAYNVDVEVVFQFRRPLSIGANTEPYQTISNGEVTTHIPQAS